MGNVEALRNSLYGDLERGLPRQGEHIQIHDPQEVLVQAEDLVPAVTELINNCLDKGAKTITVEIGQGRIAVEDDVVHTPEELARILANVRAERPKTTKGPDPDFGFPIGGVGIMSVRLYLSNYQGTLAYETTGDMRIRAVASWPNRF